jgi:hypothetical protein
MKNPTEMLKDIKNILGIELSEDVKEVEATEQVEANLEAEEATKVELAQAKLENGTVLEAEAFEAGNEIFIVTEDEKVAVPVGDYTMEDGKILVVAEEGIIGEIKEAGEEEEEEVEAAEEEMAYATKEELAEVKSMIEEIKAMIKDKEEMAEEKAKEEEVLKEELSAPAAAPLKHNPETETKKNQVLFSQRRATSTRDRVFQKIANLK